MSIGDSQGFEAVAADPIGFRGISPSLAGGGRANQDFLHIYQAGLPLPPLFPAGLIFMGVCADDDIGSARIPGRW